MEHFPAVLAEASMRLAEAVSVGSGSLKKQDVRRITQRWQREARGNTPQPKPTKEQFFANLAMAGISVG